VSNATVTSVLARCLLDVGFLERVHAHPHSALREYAVDERTRSDLASLEIDRVRSFAAFIARVQHNFLWESFPYTVKLMKLHGIELAVFANYLGTHQRLRRSGVSIDERLVAFLGYLRGYLESVPMPQRSTMLDVLTHEQAEWQVRRGHAAVPAIHPRRGARPPVGSGEFLRLVPVVRGVLRLASFSRDPCAMIDLIARGEDGAELLPLRPAWLAYWSDGESLHVLEVDAYSAALLSEVNGSRSVRTVIRRSFRGASTLPDRLEIRSLFEGLAECGLLALVSRKDLCHAHRAG
jgi:hypothetical protein